MDGTRMVVSMNRSFIHLGTMVPCYCDTLTLYFKAYASVAKLALEIKFN